MLAVGDLRIDFASRLVFVRSAEVRLGRIIECHLAHRLAEAGRSTQSDGPFAVGDARVAVSSTPTAFRVAITASDAAAARRIVEAGRALAGR